jgi:hypothetical protein
MDIILLTLVLMLFRVKLSAEPVHAYDRVLKQLVSVSSGSSIKAAVHSKNKVEEIIVLIT